MPDLHDSLDETELSPSLPPDDRADDQVDDAPEHEADDREHRVAHRPNPLPAREEDEEDLAEADILHELDLDDDSDLDRIDRPSPDA